MNARGADLVSPGMLASLTADLAGLLGDGDAATTFTLDTPTAAAADYASGQTVSDTAQTTHSSLLETLSLRAIEGSGGRLQVGDRAVRVLASALTVEPTTDSTVTVVGSSGAADRYAVVSAVLDPLGLHWLLTLRLRK
jgi:hypothetical protein